MPPIPDSSLGQKKATRTFSAHEMTQLRKAGVFEFPSDTKAAFADVCKVLQRDFHATVVSGLSDCKDQFQFQLTVSAKEIHIVVKIEDRPDCSRISIRPTIASWAVLCGPGFDSFCSNVFDSIIEIRHVIRPYYP